MYVAVSSAQCKLDVDFLERYSTEVACEEALFEAKWPEGFSCPRCSHRRAYRIQTRKLFECANCGYQASLTAGTVFENTQTPLTKWFAAMYLLSRPNGISAKELQRTICVTYKTAWSMATKLRYAIHRELESKLLTGRVQIHTNVYGKRLLQPTHEAQPYEHPMIIAGSLNDNGEPERIKMKWLPRRSDHHRLLRVIRETALRVNPIDLEQFKKSYICPTAVPIFPTRSYHQWFHQPLRTLVFDVANWIRGTFNGVTTKHLQAYLDEYSYRHHALGGRNYRAITPRHKARSTASVAPNDIGAMAFNLLKLCTSLPALTYAQITKKPLPPELATAA